ncbi:YARHG domain-containing protein [Carboxylicivirga mesophila]|uniref:YARHG domain-containing protein n=1 Tax=Carboxylicivirga mesophila TaxID=1166478 RepID=A0ABS5KGD2_9BACT|nr:YARHG domain-containing protein [Carboxylicivirga mesophila]MBS2214055.1 YARHG domain-containing protein [Carboxylicivirga mesophila]
MKRGALALVILITSLFDIASQEVLSEMRIFRNEIFARHGRTFSSSDLKNYFENQEWYKPSQNFNISSLTKKEILAANTIKNIENNYSNLSSKEKHTVLEIFAFIKSNLHNKLDTTFYTIADFDNFPGLDTVTTRILEKEYGEFNIVYSLLRKGTVIWSTKSSNPYFWLGDNQLFQEWDNHYFYGYLALKNCRAKRVDMWKPLEEEVLNQIVSIGYTEIQDEASNISKSEYKRFIVNYSGELIEHSQFEAGSKLQIWFEPIKKFISFYAP